MFAGAFKGGRGRKGIQFAAAAAALTFATTSVMAGGGGGGWHGAPPRGGGGGGGWHGAPPPRGGGGGWYRGGNCNSGWNSGWNCNSGSNFAFGLSLNFVDSCYSGSSVGFAYGSGGYGGPYYGGYYRYGYRPYCAPPVVVAPPCPPPVIVAPCPAPVVYASAPAPVVVQQAAPVVVQQPATVVVEKQVVVEKPVVVQASQQQVQQQPAAPSYQDRELGDAYLRMSDYSNAVRVYSRYLSGWNGDGVAIRNLGFALLASGDAREGFRDVAGGYAVEPAMFQRPLTQADVGGAQACEKILDGALRSATSLNTADAWFTVALLEHIAGNRTAALSSIQKAKDAGLSLNLLDSLTLMVSRQSS